jgi:iron complex transport system permease protein
MKGYITIRANHLPFSFLVRRRTILAVLALLSLSVLVMILSVGVGSMTISPVDVVKTFLGMSSKQHELVVYSFRLPRIITSFLVGGSLAISGAILQGLIRNPLASPDIIGTTGGASVAVVALMYVFPKASIHWMPPAAFLGATISTLLVYSLAWKSSISPTRLVLVGLGIMAGANGLTMLLQLINPSVYAISQLSLWLVGSVYASSWNNVLTLLPWVLLLMPAAWALSRDLNAQQLGRNIAVAIGSPVEVRTLLLILISAGLAGGAVATGGGIGFVGLMAPHVARMLVGPSHEQLLPVAGLVGGLLVMIADLIGRTAFPPNDLAAGIFTAVAGVPFFIYLLYRRRNA